MTFTRLVPIAFLPRSAQPAAAVWACALGAAFVLSGCLGDDFDTSGAPRAADLSDWVAQQQRIVQPSIVTIHEPSVFDPEPYEGNSGQDIFQAPRLTSVLAKEGRTNGGAHLIERERDRRKEPLEAHPMDSIIMVGSLNQAGRQTALLRVGELIYQVRPGNYVGQNYGRIESVSEASVQIREILQDPASGDWQEKITTIELQEQGK